MASSTSAGHSAAAIGPKKTLNFWQIWNMSFGFLGIQFGWSLQMANMSPIYEYLGAEPDKIPLLWLAAPMTGLLVQPIIGYYSDRTWTRLGRRRPYFLVGAILSSIALFLMPQSSALWMAAGLLWILDASINISMEPMRAFVVDMLPEKQHSRGFAFQSFMIGIGSVVASAMPWMLSNWFGFTHDGSGGIPDSIKWSFYTGAVVLLVAVLYTVFTTKPYPPADMEAFKAFQKEASIKGMFHEVFGAIAHMPDTMKKVALVQFFTWPALFLFWFYYGPAVAVGIFGAEPGTPEYTRGVEFAGLTQSFYNLVTFAVALALPFLAGRLGNPLTHIIGLLAGAAGLFSLQLIDNPNMLFLSMAGIGVAWASILAMPYAMLASSLPAGQTGLYMGIFNFFIVLPEIIASLFFGPIMEHVLDNDRMAAITVAGGLMVLAALLTLRIKKSN
jgi:maltose/moltooligosaccharide transporter